MNMKDLIIAQSRILQKEDLQGRGVLNLITTAGVIRGIPVFSDYEPNSMDEKLMLRVFPVFRDSVRLYGDNSSFMLRDVLIRGENKSMRLPWLAIRFDSVIACSFDIETV